MTNNKHFILAFCLVFRGSEKGGEVQEKSKNKKWKIEGEKWEGCQVECEIRRPQIFPHDGNYFSGEGKNEKFVTKFFGGEIFSLQMKCGAKNYHHNREFFYFKPFVNSFLSFFAKFLISLLVLTRKLSIS